MTKGVNESAKSLLENDDVISSIIRILRGDQTFFAKLKIEPPHRFRRWGLILIYWFGLFLNGFHWFSETLRNGMILWYGIRGGLYAVILGSLYIPIWFSLGSSWIPSYKSRSKRNRLAQYSRDIQSLALLPPIIGLFILRDLFLFVDTAGQTFLISWILLITPGAFLVLLPFWGWAFYIMAKGYSELSTENKPFDRGFRFSITSGFLAAFVTWFFVFVPRLFVSMGYYEGVYLIVKGANIAVFYITGFFAVIFTLREIRFSFLSPLPKENVPLPELIQRLKTEKSPYRLLDLIEDLGEQKVEDNAKEILPLIIEIWERFQSGVFGRWDKGKPEDLDRMFKEVINKLEDLKND